MCVCVCLLSFFAVFRCVCPCVLRLRFAVCGFWRCVWVDVYHTYTYQLGQQNANMISYLNCQNVWKTAKRNKNGFLPCVYPSTLLSVAWMQQTKPSLCWQTNTFCPHFPPPPPPSLCQSYTVCIEWRGVTASISLFLCALDCPVGEWFLPGKVKVGLATCKDGGFVKL